jgi:glycosyltransferase involved in cell wall biosynthesis
MTPTLVGATPARGRPLSVIIPARNEAETIETAVGSILASTYEPLEVIVVDDGSTDGTGPIVQRLAAGDPRLRLIQAGELPPGWFGKPYACWQGYRAATGDILVYLDADCRAPLTWLERVERRFLRTPDLIALSGPYRYYDWDWWGRLLIRAYDFSLAPATQFLVKYLLRIGTIFYGGNFAVRADALEEIGGFDTSIEFHGEDTNVGRRLFAVGRVEMCHECYLYTSARRYNAMGKGAVFRLYVRNFTSEVLHHRPRDTSHVDVRG